MTVGPIPPCTVPRVVKAGRLTTRAANTRPARSAGMDDLTGPGGPAGPMLAHAPAIRARRALPRSETSSVAP